MKIVFFGLGSIGKRHAEILLERSAHELYALRSGERPLGNEFGIRELRGWEEVKGVSPDVAFITNPTFMHIETALRCVDSGMKLFVEKPVGSSEAGLDELLARIREKRTVTYVAYNLRFHPVIEELKRYLEGKEVFHVSVYNSSFLPDWRPEKWRVTPDFRLSGEKGGGVILDLSHEFDYIEYLFGEITGMSGSFDKVSGITEDAEDFVDACIRTRRSHVNLHMDFMSRHKERSLKIDLPGEYIHADLVENRISYYANGDVRVSEFDIDRKETYRRQLDYFFDNIDNCGMMNNLVDASRLYRKVLDLKKGAR